MFANRSVGRIDFPRKGAKPQRRKEIKTNCARSFSNAHDSSPTNMRLWTIHPNSTPGDYWLHGVKASWLRRSCKEARAAIATIPSSPDSLRTKIRSKPLPLISVSYITKQPWEVLIDLPTKVRRPASSTRRRP